MRETAFEHKGLSTNRPLNNWAQVNLLLNHAINQIVPFKCLYLLPGK